MSLFLASVPLQAPTTLPALQPPMWDDDLLTSPEASVTPESKRHHGALPPLGHPQLPHLHLSWVLPLPTLPPTPTRCPELCRTTCSQPWLGYRPLSCTLPAGLPGHSQLKLGERLLPFLELPPPATAPHPQCT